jgi:hypothetical protein
MCFFLVSLKSGLGEDFLSTNITGLLDAMNTHHVAAVGRVIPQQLSTGLAGVPLDVRVGDDVLSKTRLEFK